MKHKGWYGRPGVRILEGRWQEFFKDGRTYLPKKWSTTAGTESNPPDDNGGGDDDDDNNDDDGESASPPEMDIGKFDIVYFDTFSEGYRGHFAFIKHVPRLLRGPGSRFSYFNGHAAKSATEYEVMFLWFFFPFLFRLFYFFLCGRYLYSSTYNLFFFSHLFPE